MQMVFYSEEAAARIAVQGVERRCEMQLMQECARVPVGTSVGFSWRGLGHVVRVFAKTEICLIG